MKKVDILLYNAEILTMDLNFTHFMNGAIAVNGKVIEAVGEEKEILSCHS